MKGVVVHFDPERGFGFVRSPEQEGDVFVHVREVKDRQDLSIGQTVRFEVRKGEKGPEAFNVIPGGKAVSPVIGVALLALLLSGAIALALIQWLDWPVLGTWLIGINVVTFFTYAWDKWQARRRRFRIPERALHFEAIVGGTIGALVAQSLFRHKSTKGRFRVIFWTIFLLQAAGIVWYLIAKD